MTTLIRNFVHGAASLLEIQPLPDPRPTRPVKRRTDAEALRGDWQQVGGDLHRAIGAVGKEIGADESQRSG